MADGPGAHTAAITGASLRRFVLGFTTVLLLALATLATPPTARAAVDPDVAAARATYLAAVADDDAAREVLASATTARTTAKDNVASALSTLQNAAAAYQADPTPSTWEARNTARYMLADAKSAYSEARTAYTSAKVTRDGTLATRQAALAAYQAALAG
ncbi:hypothetical protein F0U44_07065 [Nocardioides humilatus]|uniref:Uncharacterized protein n=1 Tax=Nocardioides humilatus TaxID=2607660 RepID=A0A5B1LK54_9ACTN|nr:hypothetical protein [Nocardioides humilatus]KAA1420180.1 hypothetical protein F0U44_07065 [Nocardioides humilatus]